MKELVIFDLDGTLLNSIGDLARCANYALGQCGYPAHPKQAYNLMVGNGVTKLLERALPEDHRTAEELARLREVFTPYYDRHKADLTAPYAGISELLASIQCRGVKMAVASNKYDSATKALVAHYFPGVEFAMVLGSREGVAPKPDPTIVNDILAATGVMKENVFFVGDTNVDMQTAINAGVDAVAVSWGFRPRAELEKFSPAHIIDLPQELLAFL